MSDRKTTPKEDAGDDDGLPKAMTVLGPIYGDELGSVLFNERVLSKPPPVAEGDSNWKLPLTWENLARIRQYPFDNCDNLTLPLHHASRELRQVRISSKSNVPIQTVLDTTQCTHGRDFDGLRTLAKQLQWNIICGTTPTQLAQLKCGESDTSVIQAATDEDIERMEHELKHGGGPRPEKGEQQSNTNTGDSSSKVRPGFIGELVVGVTTLATSDHISHTLGQYDVRRIKACVVVQHSTGAPLLLAVPLHLAHAVLDLVEASGGDLTKVVLTRIDYFYYRHCHFHLEEGKARARDTALELVVSTVLNRRVNVCFDRMGVSPVSWNLDNQYPPSITDVIQELIVPILLRRRGYLSQLLVSGGVEMKLQYHQFGGLGYSLVTQHFLPRLRKALSEPQEHNQQQVNADGVIQTILVTNPQRLLTWWTPPPPPEPIKEYIACSICHKMFEPILGTYYQKYMFTYCGRDCLKRHRLAKFCALDKLPPA